MNLKEMMKRVEYPFSRNLVLLSVAIAGVSTVFAVMILNEGEPERLYLGTVGIPKSILLFILTTAAMTLAIMLIKIRIYSGSPTQGTGEMYSPSAEETVKSFKRSLTLLYLAVVIIIIVIPLLALVVPELWWFIAVTSFVGAINISEVIIYTFAGRRH